MTHPYNNLDYAAGLAEDDSVELSRSLGVPLRLRAIAGTDLRDASGLYPLSPDLYPASRADLLAELGALNAVSLVLVSDPFATAVPACFDVARPYKLHHVIDPVLGPPSFSKHHRAEVRRARRYCEARQILLADHLGDFLRLYDVLVSRHNLGMRHFFGQASFAHLASHPDDFPTFGAFVGNRLVSAHIWTRADNFVYSHLAASDAEGYEIGASYLVYDEAITSLGGCMITLGGGPDGAQSDGLARFKRGFANATRYTHLCGIIADRVSYDALSAPARRMGARSDFFPLYRSLPSDQPRD